MSTLRQLKLERFPITGRALHPECSIREFSPLALDSVGCELKPQAAEGTRFIHPERCITLRLLHKIDQNDPIEAVVHIVTGLTSVQLERADLDKGFFNRKAVIENQCIGLRSRALVARKFNLGGNRVANIRGGTTR